MADEPKPTDTKAKAATSLLASAKAAMEGAGAPLELALQAWADYFQTNVKNPPALQVIAQLTAAVQNLEQAIRNARDIQE